MIRSFILTVVCASFLVVSAVPSTAAELLIGAAGADITPAEPAALMGQFHLRVSQKVETPVTANVIVLESRDGEKSLDSAIMVSCDLCEIPAKLVDEVREAVLRRLPEVDVRKIFINTTHTHTAPVLNTNGWYQIPKTGVVQIEAYNRFFADRVAGAIDQAWKARKPGSVTWGLGHAVVAQNRRAVYADGHAVMYGRTDQPDFRGLEGYEDHDVGTLFFWNASGQMVAMAVNVSCPSQEVEGGSNINADFWHPVREALRKQYGADVCVLGWTGAAGDASPHVIYRKNAEERMRQLRQLSPLEEIARRIVNAVNEAYDVVKDDRHHDVVLVHRVETIQLPRRLVTEQEYLSARDARDSAVAEMEKNPAAGPKGAYSRMKWHGDVVRRFEEQKTDPAPVYGMELHVLRIGNAVVCTNPFELFTEYGIRIKARSPAVQTFLVQLVGSDEGGYLPTAKAVRGGHYSAVVESGNVGPEGGQILVDETVKHIRELFK